MSIGEVLDRLRAEFPEVTISKLRFLEAEGLVEPQRTAAGYRKYAVADLARLRFVLAAQRDHYLPLRVIREQLAALDRGEPAERVARPPLQPVDAPAAQPEPALMSRTELVDRSGANETMLTELEEHGLIRSRGGRFDGDALTVAAVAVQLAGYGLQARHLRGYRAAADREVGLLTQLVAPLARQSTPAARARAAEAVRELTALSQQLHAALVRGGLRDTLGP
jgi:DNA-binding transcriptional MerR regulator